MRFGEYFCHVEQAYRRSLGNFIILCLCFLYIQVMIGGITRLTGSGLSITKWEVVTGTIPPLNTEAWNDAFDLYKASPQYKLINEGMSLSEFKSIYFWEWIHRLWGRVVGMLVLGFFILALIRKRLDAVWIRRFLIFLFLYACQGIMGWFMVMSGLSDMPYVSHYRLAAHLVLAIILFAYMLWMLVQLRSSEKDWIVNPKLKRFAWIIVGLLLLQIVYGAFMSGLRAAIEFPSWPMMNGQWIPDNLFLDSNPFWKNFLDYKPTIQFVHRNLAYLLVFVIMYFWFRIRNLKGSRLFAFSRAALPVLLFVQIALGVTVLLKSRTGIPVSWGVIHQLVGLLLFSDFLIIAFHLKARGRAANQLE